MFARPKSRGRIFRAEWRWRGKGGAASSKSNNKSEGHSRALGVVNCVSHCVWSFGRRFENAFVLLELWRERRLRNLLWDDGRGGTRRGAAEELAGGAAEKIHEHAEDEDH